MSTNEQTLVPRLIVTATVTLLGLALFEVFKLSLLEAADLRPIWSQALSVLFAAVFATAGAAWGFRELDRAEAVAADQALARLRAREELERAREEIDRRVVERTATLLESNESLQQEIEEREALEQELRTKEEQYRTVFEASIDGLVIFDTEGRVVQANPAMAAMHGWTLDEFEELDPTRFITSGSLDMFDEFREVCGRGETYRCDAFNMHRDGTPIPIEVRGRPIVLNGERHFLAVVHDMTDRQSAEASALDRERYYRAILSNAFEAVALVDRDLRVLFVTDSVKVILGYEPSEIEGRGTYEFSREEDIPRAYELYRRLLEEPDREQRMEMRLRHKDGDYRLVEWRAMNCFDDPAIKAIIANFRDVTETREAEEALRQSERKYRRLVELAQEGVWSIDRDSITTYVNPAMAGMIGYTPEEMVGRPMFEFMPDDAMTYASNNVERRKLGISEQHDFTLKHKDGRHIRTTMATAPVLGEDGEYEGAIAGVMDLSERISLEERLRQAEKMEALGQLAGGVAHDFNNLLLAISGNIELLGREFDESDRAYRYVLEARDAARRAKAVTRQLLAFGRQSLQPPVVVDLNEVLSEVSGLLGRLIGEQITIDFSTWDKESLCVRGSEDQLVQVLMNLAVNARDAMPEGGRLSICLEPAVGEDGPLASIIVEDDGEGMSPDQLERIFDPFYSTKEPGKGTGLGLATVYGIVRQHEGQIDVRSELGKGSRFEITLPRVRSERRDPSTTRMRPPSETGGDETVLVVEDDLAVRGLVKEVLELSGYRVLTAEDGETALELSRSFKGRIALLITDLVMPGMSGRRLVEEVQPERPDMKVLYSSGYNEESFEVSEGEDFLEKPYMPDVLTSKVRDLLDAAS